MGGLLAALLDGEATLDDFTVRTDTLAVEALAKATLAVPGAR